MPSFIQDLNHFGNVFAEHAGLAVKTSLANDEVKFYETQNRKFQAHTEAFPSISEYFDSKANEIEQTRTRYEEQKLKCLSGQKAAIRTLAASLHPAPVAEVSARPSVSRGESSLLAEKLRETRRALREAEDRINQNITKEDLNSRGFVSHNELRSIITNENTGIEQKIADLITDMNQSRGLPASLNSLESQLNVFEGKMTAFEDNSEQRNIVIKKHEGQLTDFEIRFETMLSSIHQVQQEREQQDRSLATVHDVVLEGSSDEQSLVIRARENADKIAALEASVEALKDQEPSSDQLHQASVSSSLLASTDVALKAESIVQQAIETLRTEGEDREKIFLGEIERLEEEIKNLRSNAQVRPIHTVIPYQPPTPPIASNEIISMARMEEYEKKLGNIENHLKSVEIFVRTQQQRFDGLTTTQLTHNMINYLTQVYAYHPENIIGQLKQHREIHNRIEAGLSMYRAQLGALNIPELVGLMKDLPIMIRNISSALTGAENAIARAETLGVFVRDLEKNLVGQIQDLAGNMELAKKDACERTDQQVKGLASLRTELYAMADTLKQSSLASQEQLTALNGVTNGLQSQINNLTNIARWPNQDRQKSQIHPVDRQMSITSSKESSLCLSTRPEQDSDDDQRLADLPRFSSSSSTTTTAPPSRKRTPDAPLKNSADLKSDDTIRRPGKRARRPGDLARSNISKGGADQV